MTNPKHVLTTKDLSPPVRGWIRQNIKDVFDEELKAQVQEQVTILVKDALHGIDRAFGELSKISNNMGIRLETLYHAIQKAKILDDATLQAAYTDLQEYQVEIQRLMQLSPEERYQAYLDWGKEPDRVTMKPGEIQLHLWLLDPKADLTLERRRELAEELGFSDKFVEVMEAKLQQTPPEPPVVKTAEEK